MPSDITQSSYRTCPSLACINIIHNCIFNVHHALLLVPTLPVPLVAPYTTRPWIYRALACLLAAAAHGDAPRVLITRTGLAAVPFTAFAVFAGFGGGRWCDGGSRAAWGGAGFDGGGERACSVGGKGCDGGNGGGQELEGDC